MSKTKNEHVPMKILQLVFPHVVGYTDLALIYWLKHCFSGKISELTYRSNVYF